MTLYLTCGKPGRCDQQCIHRIPWPRLRCQTCQSSWGSCHLCWWSALSKSSNDCHNLVWARAALSDRFGLGPEGESESESGWVMASYLYTTYFLLTLPRSSRGTNEENSIFRGETPDQSRQILLQSLWIWLVSLGHLFDKCLFSLIQEDHCWLQQLGHLNDQVEQHV